MKVQKTSLGKGRSNWHALFLFPSAGVSFAALMFFPIPGMQGQVVPSSCHIVQGGWHILLLVSHDGGG